MKKIHFTVQMLESTLAFVATAQVAKAGDVYVRSCKATDPAAFHRDLPHRQLVAGISSLPLHQ